MGRVDLSGSTGWTRPCNYPAFGRLPL